MWFVKTKTAYEMRISDWSSDVCSSDLCSGVSANASHTLSKVSILVICHLSSVRCSSETRNHTPVHRERAKPQLSVSSHASSQQLRQTPTLVRDRTSVVQGKSVSVRVDFCGRRNIRKKTRK